MFVAMQHNHLVVSLRAVDTKEKFQGEIAPPPFVPPTKAHLNEAHLRFETDKRLHTS